MPGDAAGGLRHHECMRSVDLTFEDSADQAIRNDWAALAGLGLPSLASHTSPSNRPHITLVAGAELVVAPGAQEIEDLLPIVVGFSGLVAFPAGRGKFVLARLVVPSRDLLQLHARLHRHSRGAYTHTGPDAWTPHVTLARRMTSEQLGAAVDALDVMPAARCTEARLWDSSTRTITPLGGPSDPAAPLVF